MSLQEFNRAFGKVFPGVSPDKFKHIFDEFDEESTGTINHFELLKAEQLPKLLLFLHNESTLYTKNLNQKSIVNQPSSGLSDSINTSSDENSILTQPLNRLSSLDTSDKMPSLPLKTSTPIHSGSLSIDYQSKKSSELRRGLDISASPLKPHVSVEESITSLEHQVSEKVCH